MGVEVHETCDCVNAFEATVANARLAKHIYVWLTWSGPMPSGSDMTSAPQRRLHQAVSMTSVAGRVCEKRTIESTRPILQNQQQKNRGTAMRMFVFIPRYLSSATGQTETQTFLQVLESSCLLVCVRVCVVRAARGNAQTVRHQGVRRVRSGQARSAAQGGGDPVGHGVPEPHQLRRRLPQGMEQCHVFIPSGALNPR